MRIKHIFVIIAFLIVSIVPLCAQIKIEGIVSDAETGEVIPSVIVKVCDADSQKKSIISYAVTDGQGHYVVAFSTDKDKVLLEFSLLGYQNEQLVVEAKTAVINQKLSFSSQMLKEVTAKAAAVVSRSDTIHYNVAAFATDADRNIEDVLKKLPGITVLENGQIEYQGKPINKFYIEGLDMLEGRYSLATRNISAKEIIGVQVFENHQPVRLLKNIQFSDRAALNIKLKNKKMSRPAGNVLAGGGYDTERLLYRGSAFAFMANTEMQGLLTAKAHNGDIGSYDETMSHYGTQDTHVKAGDYIDPLPFTVPWSVDRRTTSAGSLSSSVNVLHKTDSLGSVKLNIVYIEKQRTYDRTATSYYLSGDSNIVVQEDLSARRIVNSLSGNAVYERNTNTCYIKNMAKASMNADVTNMDIDMQASLNQRTRIRELSFNNDLALLWRKDKHVYNLHSLIGGGYLPENRLDIFNVDGQGVARQTNGGYSFETRTSTSFAQGFNAYANMTFAAGLDTEYDRITTRLDSLMQMSTQRNDNLGIKLLAYLTPTLNFTKDGFRLSLDVPLQYQHIHYKDDVHKTDFVYSRPKVNAGASGKYTLAPGMSLLASCRLNHATGDILSFVEQPIQTAYNRVQQGESGILAENTTMKAELGYDFRNTMEGLFSMFSVNAARIRKNVIKGNDIYTTGVLGMISQSGTTYTDRCAADVYFAKNFRDMETTISLNANYMYSSSEKLRQGRRMSYTSNIFMVVPSLSIRTLAWMQIQLQSPWEYYTQTVSTTGLSNEKLDWSLDADISFLPFKNMEVYYSLNYQNNGIEGSDGKGREVFCLMDAGLRYQPCYRAEVELCVRNIGNVQDYTSLSYVDGDKFATSYRLRPINAVLTLKYTF